MPDGRTHVGGSLAIALSIPLGYWAGQTADPTLSLSGLMLGSLAGVLISPDLDVDEGNISMRLLRSIPLIGLPLEVVWTVFWKPYALAFRHRSFMSHAPGISTAFRLLYIVLPLIIILALPNAPATASRVGIFLNTLVAQMFALLVGVALFIMVQTFPVLNNPQLFAWVLAGLVLSDILHWTFDKLL